jgi:xanthine dehydrogenase accessory factor
MTLPSEAEVLAEADRTVRTQGRVALCQLIRTEGSTPGRAGWKLLVRPDGSSHGNLGGGAFEAMVKRDAGQKLDESYPASEVKRYYLTETARRGEATGMVCGGLAEVFLEVLMAKPLLLICGGGPVGQALAGNAALCDFDVTVIDDRTLVEVDR